MLFLYLHGLNSSSRSKKAQQLREAFGAESVVAPDYPAHRPAEAVATLTAIREELFANHPTCVIIGSSMGGFYGQYIARLGRAPAHLFLINPALRPWELLRDYRDQDMTTANGEHYRLQQDAIDQTRRYGLEQPCTASPIATTIFLDQDDEIIDSRIAQHLYVDCARVFLYPGGDHAFSQMEQAIGVIRNSVLAV